MANSLDIPLPASQVIVHLLRGVIYGDQRPDLWGNLLAYQGPIRAYLAVIGLELFIDESEGYAFVRQRSEVNESEVDNPTLPRLVQRRPLSYHLSLLCILLRKRLIEADATGGETRVILERQQIVDMMRVFMAESSNEAKTVEQIGSLINRLVEYGFLRKLPNQDDQFEIRRIIKALIDADWLADIDRKLQEYRDHAE